MNRYANIPDELKKQNHWVCVWKNSKVPMNPLTGKGASSSDPNAWCDYQTALRSVETGDYSNLGYVFNDNGLVGIDIDCGFDEDNFLTELCVDIIKTCKSYTEISRSGRGVHILVKGDIPFKGKNNGTGVEIYKTSRYFIMTGQKLLYDKIISNQQAIDHVLNKYFVDVAKTPENKLINKRIYSPIYQKPQQGKISLKPEYPEIGAGMRNISLTSLAGQLHTQGYSGSEIYNELTEVNRKVCKPPLAVGEIKTIVRSVTRYKR